jgi:4-alpha-glucanotransferase
MKIKFNITYHTIWGQKMMVFGNLPELGNNQELNALPMYAKDSSKGQWDLEIDLTDKKIQKLEYKYVLLDDQHGVHFVEHGPMRKIFNKDRKTKEVVLFDHWQSSTDPENVMFTSAFLKALTKPKSFVLETEGLKPSEEEVILRFQIPITRIENSHRVGIYGGAKSLGGWDKGNVVSMENSNYPIWSAEVIVKKAEFPIEYKYCILDEDNHEIVFDEENENRVLIWDSFHEGSTIICSDKGFRYPRYPWKGAGVAIPVFSLRTKNSFGVGEFLDIKPLVDWAKRTGLKLIQLLPINDTVATHSWVDSCPYSGISVFALHPIYLNLKGIGNLSSKVTQEIIDTQGRFLNSLTQLDYEMVMKVKSRFFKMIYDEQKSTFLKDKDFNHFFNQNSQWLKPYAAFSYLRDLYGTTDFSTWERFSQYTLEIIDEITDPKAPQFDDIAVHYFIQYHLHKQMLEAAQYARENGVVLKGDIPIGIYRNSVDAWVAPHLYNMSVQAGAPPDDFSETGQNWKFPTYNWGEMSKDGFSWWVNRLKKMSEYFDAYRIDHILGFFRIWEIPTHSVQGIMGWFNPAIPIHRNEIYDQGIWFDYDRYTKPYIREYMIGPIFGYDGDHIKEKYLDEYAPGCFVFKSLFDTQKKVHDHLKLGPQASSEERAFNEKIQEGLFRLLGEVLFFEVPYSNGMQFHPRHSMFKTYSFSALDQGTQNRLYELYIDYFYRRNESFWREQAMVKLPAIKNATNMLSCGEDLGMVPDCVPSLMSELGILSLEVQRMPKNPKVEFGHPADYPYLSVATPSSHDTSTIRGWWEEDSSRSQRFYNTILGRWGASPYFCDTSIVKDIVNQHFYSPSMWAIFPIQDLIGTNEELMHKDAKAERINLPSVPVYYWRYRFHLNIEDLLTKDHLNDYILDLVKKSGRDGAY